MTRAEERAQGCWHEETKEFNWDLYADLCESEAYWDDHEDDVADEYDSYEDPDRLFDDLVAKCEEFAR